MELLKKFFKDDEKVIGLSSFKKITPKKTYSFERKFNSNKLYYCTNTKNNFFLI